MLCDPLVDLAPFQAPEAVQLAASLEDHCSVALAPLAIVLGAALRITVGAGAVEPPLTVTVADWLAAPPGPEQVSVYVNESLKVPVEADPLVARSPLQPSEAVQAAASVLLQLIVALCPLETVLGLTVKDTLGTAAATVTVTDWLAVPLGPSQLRSKSVVAVRAPVS